VADQQGDRLDALALGADHQPLDVVVGMILGLFLAEGRGEPLVEVDQLLGPRRARPSGVMEAPS